MVRVQVALYLAATSQSMSTDTVSKWDHTITVHHQSPPESHPPRPGGRPLLSQGILGNTGAIPENVPQVIKEEEAEVRKIRAL